jgi:hypothetical protein
MKRYLLLVLLLYLFGVVLRIAGQALNGETIQWKSTILLGEFDGTQDFDKRWFVRIGLMLSLPLLFVKPVFRK